MKNVLILDSGSGGLNILLECVKQVPRCNYLLFCDDKNLPYGDKTKQELVSLTERNLKNIKRFFDFEIVVVGCNTLTCACVDECRKMWKDVIFIGTEPPLKPALEKYLPNEILVLATKFTSKNNHLLLENSNVKTLAMIKLAGLIDENLDDLTKVENYLSDCLKNYSPKALVLGCTHYGLICDEFKKLFKDVEIFDSKFGVAKRLKHFVGDVDENFQVQIMTSKSDEFRAKLLWKFQSEIK